MIDKKTVIIGITGSIAAYKMANVASMLIKKGCDVHVIMTENASKFITPMTFETLTGNKCIVNTFDRNFEFDVKHISLAKKADVFLVAPATANIISKMAYGIADDMLSTTILACNCKKIVSPAMNTNMFNNPIVQDNINKLRQYGFEIIPPDKGMLACRDIGDGKLPKEETIFNYVMREISCKKDMKGLKVIVTAGATQESLDPVRYITNHSTGKMGYELAKACMFRGAEVVLISGQTSLEVVPFVKMINIKTAEDMFNAVKSEFENCDIVIKAAAVADYRPSKVENDKIKKSDENISISLERTKDILKYLGQHKKDNQYLCGFSMETKDMVENSRKKLYKKNLDMIVANNLKESGAGFGTDTNIVTIITKDTEEKFELMSKEKISHIIIDNIMSFRVK